MLIHAYMPLDSCQLGAPNGLGMDLSVASHDLLPFEAVFGMLFGFMFPEIFLLSLSSELTHNVGSLESKAHI
jgi:hypothetical protein